MNMVLIIYTKTYYFVGDFMNYLKTIGKAFLFSLGWLLFLTFLVTFFNYFNIVNTKIVHVLCIIIPIISLFIGGMIVGKKSKKKGWLEGLKYGLLFLVLLALFNYFGLQNHFIFKNLLYYGILLIASIFGSMFGINFKNSK